MREKCQYVVLTLLHGRSCLRGAAEWDEVRWRRMVENMASGWQAAAEFLRVTWCFPQCIYSTELGICILLPCITFAGPTDYSFWNPGLFCPVWRWHNVYTLTLRQCPNSFVLFKWNFNQVSAKKKICSSIWMTFEETLEIDSFSMFNYCTSFKFPFYPSVLAIMFLFDLFLNLFLCSCLDRCLCLCHFLNILSTLWLLSLLLLKKKPTQIPRNLGRKWKVNCFSLWAEIYRFLFTQKSTE